MKGGRFWRIFLRLRIFVRRLVDSMRRIAVIVVVIVILCMLRRLVGSWGGNCFLCSGAGAGAGVIVRGGEGEAEAENERDRVIETMIRVEDGVVIGIGLGMEIGIGRGKEIVGIGMVGGEMGGRQGKEARKGERGLSNGIGKKRRSRDVFVFGWLKFRWVGFWELTRVRVIFYFLFWQVKTLFRGVLWNLTVGWMYDGGVYGWIGEETGLVRFVYCLVCLWSMKCFMN